MPGYRFVLHECSGTTTRDKDCRDFADLEVAKAASVAEARSIMAREIENGRLCLSCWIVILDEKDRNLFTLHFSDAVRLNGQGACSAA